MPRLKKNHLVEKRNVLNDMRAHSMTLQELKLFSIYLSKINSRDISTRVVRFTVNDFKTIMDLDRIKIDHMKDVTNRLLSRIVKVPNERGGHTAFQLFKQCTVDMDKNGDWYVEIDAHDKALPLMFDFQRDYFTYKIWNALKLRSPNQLRMYEILKQYQSAGFRILSLEELRELLWIGKDEYKAYKDFRVRVLDA